ncbi:hypothetical protein L1987_32420 [Smallanthus sonchifolius]|uniref:Uncharacterized protein n=1 Tax=Smallanthus sonchifolius TaxID=185202 RepID=A0ACB9HMY5_9ASTR|nr:hypothetical protein L1987_32420 [Smallanthus sonchifolius]
MWHSFPSELFLDYKPSSRERNWQEDQSMTLYGRKLMSRILNVFSRLTVELEGLWVKMRQYLSTRADMLPLAYTRL